MKSCPQCNQSYTDETLNFCLNDGAVLVAAPRAESTVMMNPPAATAGKQNFNSPGFVGVRAQKKSNAWVWVLGIFLGLIIIGGIGFIGLVALVASMPDSANSDQNRKDIYDSSGDKNDYSAGNKDIIKDDFSDWDISSNIYGKTTYENYELLISSIRSDYFFVVTSGKTFQQTQNSSTKVMARNPSGKKSLTGFGLIIHGDQKDPLDQGYGFLIDSFSRKYRIVRMDSGKEVEIIGWSDSSSISPNTDYNELEVKDENGSMSFYINGQLIKTIKDSAGNKSGVVGLYSSGAIPIGFSWLEIRRN